MSIFFEEIFNPMDSRTTISAKTTIRNYLSGVYSKHSSSKKQHRDIPFFFKSSFGQIISLRFSLHGNHLVSVAKALISAISGNFGPTGL